MGWEGNPIFVHVSQSLGDWSHLNYRILATDDGTGPKVRGQLGSFGIGELWQEQGKDHEDFPKGDGPADLWRRSEPLGTFTFLSTPYSEVAQEESLRLFHRRDSLVRYTLVEQCQQRIVREVDGRYEQGNRRAPLVSIHDSFKADPGSEPQWRSHPISDRYDFRVSEFEVS